MQYNDSTGDLHITDKVQAGADVTVAGKLYCAAGFPPARIVPVVSALKANAASGAVSLSIPANTAPNFIMVTASAWIGASIPGGDYTLGSAYKTLSLTNISRGTVAIGELRISCEGAVSASGGTSSDQEALYTYASCAISLCLKANDDYASSGSVVIDLAAAVGNVLADANSNLAVICG